MDLESNRISVPPFLPEDKQRSILRDVIVIFKVVRFLNFENKGLWMMTKTMKMVV